MGHRFKKRNCSTICQCSFHKSSKLGNVCIQATRRWECFVKKGYRPISLLGFTSFVFTRKTLSKNAQFLPASNISACRNTTSCKSFMACYLRNLKSVTTGGERKEVDKPKRVCFTLVFQKISTSRQPWTGNMHQGGWSTLDCTYRFLCQILQPHHLLTPYVSHRLRSHPRSAENAQLL